MISTLFIVYGGLNLFCVATFVIDWCLMFYYVTQNKLD